jgi:hypothetical protein
MNLNQFLIDSKPIKYKSKSSLNEISGLLRPFIESSMNNQRLPSPENYLKKLEEKLSNKPEYQLKSPEDLLPALKKQIKSVRVASDHIKELAATSLNANISQNTYKIKRKTLNSFWIPDTPIEYTFKSKPNTLTTSFLHSVRPRKASNNYYTIETEPETLETVKKEFQALNIDFKPLPNRYSISTLSSKTAAISEKSRYRVHTVYNTPNTLTNTSISSSSSSEEIPIYYNKSLNPNTHLHPTGFLDIQSTPITNKDFKSSGSKSLIYSIPQEISNSEAVKFGYMLKRRRESNKFHKRWVVLRDFKMFWYIKHTSSMPKGVVSLGKTLVYGTEAGKEKCLAIQSKGRVVQFKNDGLGSDWKALINSQICFKGYLEDCDDYNLNLLEYFQDLKSSTIELHKAEIKENIFKYFINALPAHTSLQILRLVKCELTDSNVTAMCKLIKDSCGIQTLDLSENFLTSRCVQSISSLIKQEEMKYNTILNLNLSHNSIKDEGVEVLSRAFLVRFEQLFLPKLIHQLPFYSLKLNYVDMEDVGLNALSTVFYKAYNLMLGEDIDSKIQLGIAGNHFTDKSFGKFIESICQYQGIKELDISNCTSIYDNEIILLAESFSSSYSLVDLNISGINITRYAFSKVFPLLAKNYALSKIKLRIDDEFKIAVMEKANAIKDVFEIEGLNCI